MTHGTKKKVIENYFGFGFTTLKKHFKISAIPKVSITV